jgi:hypothetical protein
MLVLLIYCHSSRFCSSPEPYKHKLCCTCMQWRMPEVCENPSVYKSHLPGRTVEGRHLKFDLI